MPTAKSGKPAPTAPTSSEDRGRRSAYAPPRASSPLAKRRHLTYTSPRASTPPPTQRRHVIDAATRYHHGMLTRSRGNTFRIMELPAQLRNNIYSYASHDPNPIQLTDVRLPPFAHVSKIIRSEVLPAFFKENVFSAAVTTNWCVSHNEFFGPKGQLYARSGSIGLHPLLDLGPYRLSYEAVRFGHVKFSVICYCFHGRAVSIGEVDIKSVGERVAELLVDTTVPEQTKSALIKMGTAAKNVAKAAKAREQFNGFSVEDLLEIGACFRDTREENVWRKCQGRVSLGKVLRIGKKESRGNLESS